MNMECSEYAEKRDKPRLEDEQRDVLHSLHFFFPDSESATKQARAKEMWHTRLVHPQRCLNLA